MRYTKLGKTGLDVSVLCLGCMGLADGSRGNHPWAIGEEASREIVRRALDAGINFFDTANFYSGGSSEEYIGRFLAEMADRDEVVLATKVCIPMREGPNGGGLSRKAIMSEIDHSLRRLRTDYVDLYQIHRWDYGTPIEETMEALHDVVKAGKARYIGASSMFAWQFAKALHVAEREGWTRFVSMQNHYNLLYREEEREMLPLCVDEQIGVMPWSPLARGRLGRGPGVETARSGSDEFGDALYQEADRAVIKRNAEVAARLGVPPAQLALAWLMRHPTVTAPIVGPTKLGHLDDAIAAVDLELSDADTVLLEEPYIPHAISGHS
ncbi:MAG TPA: aldo/keto reductase [Solirubrobacterales bacterium]|jgi:aryl-alcohol dehydrogenase (NADP+)|nr:aldo/keto reductase [Solirubrobacterales bacterium]